MKISLKLAKLALKRAKNGLKSAESDKKLLIVWRI